MRARACFSCALATLTVSALLSLLAACNALGQGQARTTEFPYYPPDENTPREIIYPYYSLREGYDSTLHLENHAAWTVDFTVGVHSLSGQTALSQPMSIHPHETVEINVKKLTDDLAVDNRGDFVEGSLSLNFKGKGNPLGGRLVIAGPNGTVSVDPVSTISEWGWNKVPTRLDTLWHDLGGARDVELTVSNITGEPVVGDFYLDFGGRRHTAAPLHFASHETKNLSIATVLAEMKMTAYDAPLGGLSIVPRGAPALVAQGKITDPEAARVTALPFPLPQLELASALHATGIAIGVPSADSPFAGTGNFTPHVYLRNLLDSEQTVTLTMEYPGETAAQRTTLPPLKIAGLSTKEVTLDSYYAMLPLPLPFCALRIQYNGPPGSLMAEIDVTNGAGEVADTPRVDNEGNGYAGSGATQWAFDQEKDFLVFLTNMGEKECPVGFNIWTRGITYHLTGVKLAAHETRLINLRELRDRHEPDFRGTVIPANASEGTLSYIRLRNLPMTGRTLVWPRKKAGDPPPP